MIQMKRILAIFIFILISSCNNSNNNLSEESKNNNTEIEKQEILTSVDEVIIFDKNDKISTLSQDIKYNKLKLVFQKTNLEWLNNILKEVFFEKTGKSFEQNLEEMEKDYDELTEMIKNGELDYASGNEQIHILNYIGTRNNIITFYKEDTYSGVANFVNFKYINIDLEKKKLLTEKEIFLDYNVNESKIRKVLMEAQKYQGTNMNIEEKDYYSLYNFYFTSDGIEFYFADPFEKIIVLWKDINEILKPEYRRNLY